MNFFCSRLARVVCAETSLGNAEKYWPSMKVRDLYSLRQMSALKTIPVPAEHLETNLVILCHFWTTTSDSFYHVLQLCTSDDVPVSIIWKASGLSCDTYLHHNILQSPLFSRWSCGCIGMNFLTHTQHHLSVYMQRLKPAACCCTEITSHTTLHLSLLSQLCLDVYTIAVCGR
jgi:hypothetical protein